MSLLVYCSFVGENTVLLTVELFYQLSHMLHLCFDPQLTSQDVCLFSEIQQERRCDYTSSHQ